tara:strand:- start:147 stop:557 length:411 start_codon:yes stop_codon:yes gene_type:complete
MKKLLLLIPLLSVACQSTPEMYYYNFCSKNEWDNYSYAGHGLLTYEPIQSPSMFIRCYVDYMRTQDDVWSKKHVERYDKDTALVYIVSHGKANPVGSFKSFDRCDVKVVSGLDPVIQPGDTTIISDLEYINYKPIN